MKILISMGILILVSACSSSGMRTEPSPNQKFDKIMENASNRCLNKGFHGHEPEYRSCVIKNASELLGIRNASIQNK